MGADVDDSVFEITTYPVRYQHAKLTREDYHSHFVHHGSLRSFRAGHLVIYRNVQITIIPVIGCTCQSSFDRVVFLLIRIEISHEMIRDGMSSTETVRVSGV